MSWTNTLIKYLKSASEQAEGIDRAAKYKAQLLGAKEEDKYCLVAELSTLAAYTWENTLKTPAAPPGRCTGCGSSDFKGDRCEWCRSVREWAKT